MLFKKLPGPTAFEVAGGDESSTGNRNATEYYTMHFCLGKWSPSNDIDKKTIFKIQTCLLSST